jgi:HEAT repeat protein
MRPEADREPDAVPAGAAEWQALPRDDWHVGQRRRYAVVQRSRIASKHSEGSGSIELAGSFELTLTPFAQDARGTAVQVELRARDVTRTLNGQRASLTAQVAAQLAKPMAMVVDSTGAIRKLFVDPSVDLTTNGLVRGALSALQLVAPEPTTRRSWSVDEQDSSGEYVAQYERTGPLTVRKRKSRFKNGRDPVLNAQQRTRSASFALVLAQGSGIPERIDGTQDEVSVLQQGELRASLQVQLVLEAVTQVTPVALALDPKHESSLLDGPRSIRLGPSQYAEIARGHSVQSLLRELQTGDRSDDDARAQLMSRLEAVLRTAGDSSIAEASRAVRELQDDADARVVMGALDGAHSPAAQDALLGIANAKKLSTDRRNTALMHLGLTEEPTVETLEGLRAMSEDGELDPDLRGTAELALGGALRQAGSETLSQTSTSAQYLVERLDAASTVPERTLALEALGNSGSDQALPALKTALEDSSASVRASAANALRHLQNPEADAQLAKIASGDADTNVRSSALRALIQRTLTDETRKALSSALGQDPDVVVRMTAVDVMSKYLDQESGFQQALKQCSEHDPDTRVRERAIAVLNNESIMR